MWAILFTSQLLWAAEQKVFWTSFLATVNNAPVEQKASLIEKFLQDHKGQFPWREDKEVIFIYYGTANKVALAGDFNGWSPITPMIQVFETNLWYAKQEFPLDARIEYKLVVDAEWILDPLNDQKALGGYGYNSDLRMSKYEPTPWLTKESKEKGKIQAFTIASKILGNSRGLQVYVPFGYDAKRAHPLLVFHDGKDYLTFAHTVQILDILIEEKRIAPMIVAFIDPVERTDEYGCSEKYAQFTAQELVPFLEKNFSLSQKKSDRGFAGASMGGIVSFYLAYQMRDTFGKALCQSGAFLYQELSNKEDSPLVGKFLQTVDYSHLKESKIWLDCGTIGPLEIYLRAGNLLLLSHLQKAQIVHHYEDIPEAHNWVSWEKRIESALLYLFGENQEEKKETETKS